MILTAVTEPITGGEGMGPFSLAQLQRMPSPSSSCRWKQPKFRYALKNVALHQNMSLMPPEVVLYAHVLATSKSGTLCGPRDQVLDGGPVSSLRALL